jgi:uncharacterized membrane protein
MENGASNTRDRTGGSLIRPYILIFLAACLVMAWQFIFPGYYNKILEDAAYTHKHIIQFMGSFREGVVYPRWMPENFNGYGSPVFVFYSPLLYFCAALLGLAGLGLSSAVAWLKLAGLITGGLFLYLFAKKHVGERAALLAAISYEVIPTQVLNLYMINTPAGRFAEAFMPMSLYFMQRYMGSGFGRRRLLWFAVSYSGLVISHLATAYLFTPFLMAYGIAAGGDGLKKAAPRAALGIAAGIALSSFFFVPVLFERGFGQMDFLLQFYYKKYFILDFLRFPPYDEARPLLALPGEAVLVESIMAAATLYIAGRRGGLAPAAGMRFMEVSAAVCVFMMTSFSSLIWANAPWIRAVQFPYRFTPIYIVFISVLLGAGLSGVARLYGKSMVSASAVAVLLLGVLVFDWQLVEKSLLPISEANAGRIAEKNDIPEYLPVSVDAMVLPMLKKNDPLVSSADAAAEVKKWGSADRSFTVSSPRGARLRVKTFYFPGWRAWVDGMEVPLTAQDKTGAILMDVPAGTHGVRLKFTNTPTRTLGEALSLLTLAAFIFPYGRLRRSR